MIDTPAAATPMIRLAAEAYRLRWKRRRLLWRALRARHQLAVLADRSAQIAPGDVVAVMCVHNEITRLPYFLEHHRRLGVAHFLVVDNASDDGTAEYLADQPDLSLWHSRHSYRTARFGLDWMTWLQIRHAHDRWCLMLDADELLIYAHHETRPLPDLGQWLDQRGQSVFGALMLDLYPKGPLGTQAYRAGDDPLRTLGWFDAGPHRVRRQNPQWNLWVQGGVRDRVFFGDKDRQAPTLNKLPLVRWNRRYAYVNSCHSILPRRLNLAYSGPGGTEPSGVLLHTKFLPGIVSRSVTEKTRGEHFHDPEKFAGYYDQIAGAPDLWTPDSVAVQGWQQFERLGLMSSGGW